MNKNLIFDWSGTLSDDFTCVYNAAMIVMKELINKTISQEEFRNEFVLPYMDFWHKYIPEVTKEKCDELYPKAYTKVDGPVAYPNVKETLEKLYSKGIKMIVISSHLHEELIIEAKEYGLSKYFQQINGSIHDKTKAINDILKKNNFDKNDTYYVGDMKHDIDAGKKAGVKTIAITWGYQSRESLKKLEPDYLINDITELNKQIFS